MGTYAVTITSHADHPVDELEALYDELPGDAALSYNTVTREISATFSVDAATIHEAVETGCDTFNRVLKLAHASDFRHTEVHVCEWEVHERRLAESNMPDIVSAPEVGEILGVSRQRVHQLLAENKSFPPPLLRLGAGPIWLRSTIEAWAATPRRAGRPRGNVIGLMEALEDRIVKDANAPVVGAPETVRKRAAKSTAAVKKGSPRRRHA